MRHVRVTHAESGGDPHAVSPAGAMGVMQIMPATWAALAACTFDPHDAILAGAAHLRDARRLRLAGALATHNAGPTAMRTMCAAGGRCPAEAHAYMARVMAELGDDDPVPQPQSAHVAQRWTRAARLVARPSKRTTQAS